MFGPLPEPVFSRVKLARRKTFKIKTIKSQHSAFRHKLWRIKSRDFCKSRIRETSESRKRKRSWCFPSGPLINPLAGRASQMTAFLVNLARLFFASKGPVEWAPFVRPAAWNRKDWFALWPLWEFGLIPASRHESAIHPRVELCLLSASSPLRTAAEPPGTLARSSARCKAMPIGSWGRARISCRSYESRLRGVKLEVFPDNVQDLWLNNESKLPPLLCQKGCLVSVCLYMSFIVFSRDIPPVQKKKNK